MNELDLDRDIAGVLTGLLQVRRVLDPQSFHDLIGAVMVDIRLGIEVAEEMALEARFRGQSEGNVVSFPASKTVRSSSDMDAR